MATSTISPALDASVSDLQQALDRLQPELHTLTSTIPSTSIRSILSEPAECLHQLIAFLTARRGSSAAAAAAATAASKARDNGELQAQLAHLFAAFARAEGDAIVDGHSCETALADISEFQDAKVSPLLREFSAVKERALVLVADSARAVGAAIEEEGEAKKRVEANTERVAATSKDLDEVQARLNSMAYQMETLVERRMELEERKQEAKARREIQQSSQAMGFLSIFKPVLAPVAAVANAFSSRTTDADIRRVVAQLASLRQQTEGLNPALIEQALKELNMEHASLQHELDVAITVVATLESEKAQLETQLQHLESVHEELDSVCQQLAAAQHAVAECAAKVGEAAGRAAHAKGLCAQGITNVCRLGFVEGRRWIVALLSGVVDVVGEGREGLEACKDDEQIDEGIESGGESLRKGSMISADWSEPGDSPTDGAVELVLPPTIEEDLADDEAEEDSEGDEESESDEEAVLETVDVGVETGVAEAAEIPLPESSDEEDDIHESGPLLASHGEDIRTSAEPAPSETSESGPLLAYQGEDDEEQVLAGSSVEPSEYHNGSKEPIVSVIEEDETAYTKEERLRRGLEMQRKCLEVVHLRELEVDTSTMPGGFHSPVIGH